MDIPYVRAYIGEDWGWLRHGNITATSNISATKKKL